MTALATAEGGPSRLSSPTRARSLTVRAARDLRVFPGVTSRVALAVLGVVAILVPFGLEDKWLSVLSICGAFAILGIGLNLLTGYTGQVSLGHAFFLAVGGYVAANIGDKLGWPLPLWLLAAAVIGAAIGGLVGLFALRLSGNYLAIITIALLFIAEYLARKWTNITGGGGNLRADVPITLGPIDFAHLDAVGFTSRIQGVYWLVWGLVALAALLARNLVRSRAGRAMQAVRDRDLAAEVIGVSMFRYKMGAFAVSAAFAAVGGALYLGVVQRSIQVSSVTGIQGFLLSITFVAIIVIGGLGSVWGAILGALLVQGLPGVLEIYSGILPFVGDGKLMTITTFNNLFFGLLIVLTFLFQPEGIAAEWRRVRSRVAAWPFLS